jgi:hypothetical protein
MRNPYLFLTLCSASIVSMAAPTMSREEWGTKMTQVLATTVCEDKSFFRSCFAIDAAQCANSAVSAARACLADKAKEMPDVFTSREQSKAWGGTMGGCVGSALELRYAEQKVNTGACQSPEAWQK